MAERTRTKQMEATVDALEMGLQQTQEELSCCREENTATNSTTKEVSCTLIRDGTLYGQL